MEGKWSWAERAGEGSPGWPGRALARKHCLKDSGEPVDAFKGKWHDPISGLEGWP